MATSVFRGTRAPLLFLAVLSAARVTAGPEGSGAACALRRRRGVALRVRGGASLAAEARIAARKAAADDLQKRGEYAAAVGEYVALISAAAGADDLTAHACRVNLARCYSKLGRDAEAVAEAGRVVDAADLSPSSPLRAAAYLRRATGYRALGEARKAFLDARQAQALGDKRSLALLSDIRSDDGFDARWEAEAPPRPRPSPFDGLSGFGGGALGGARPAAGGLGGLDLGSLMGAGEGGGGAAGLAQLAALVDDPKKLRAALTSLGGLARSFGVMLEGAQKSLAGAVATALSPEGAGVEAWASRIETATRLWRRAAWCAKTGKRCMPIAIYALVLRSLAADSYRILLA
ncbi:hypothetical protein M885DRAFT_516386 [Pelagophyceae sp. CCMP2097]|nr:hypothetical protein M885DRAFT_516386 [Pelagophyceae sp. CCMP2097]